MLVKTLQESIVAVIIIWLLEVTPRHWWSVFDTFTTLCYLHKVNGHKTLEYDFVPVLELQSHPIRALCILDLLFWLAVFQVQLQKKCTKRFSLRTSASSSNTINHHDITEILLYVAFNTNNSMSLYLQSKF